MVGVLEDGKTYATELVQSRKPGEGAVAQWEHELVSCSSPSNFFTVKNIVRRSNGVEYAKKEHRQRLSGKLVRRGLFVCRFGVRRGLHRQERL